MRRHIAVAAPLMFVLTACGTAQDSPELVHTPSGVDAIVQTSSLRSILVQTDEKGRIRYCAEPAPDVALDTIREITGAIKAKAQTIGSVASPDLDANATYKLTATARELAGRSTTVVLARDLLYRLCELSINFADESDTKFQAIATRYDAVVSSIIKVMAQADAKNAEASALEAQIEAAKILGSTQSQIDAIIAALGGDKLDVQKLKKAVDSITNPKVGLSVKNTLKSATTADELRTELNNAPRIAVAELFDAVQKTK